MGQEQAGPALANGHRVVVDLAAQLVEAHLDHADASTDIWAFGVVRREIQLGADAWVYVDGFDRPRVVRVRFCAAHGWRDRLFDVCTCSAHERETIDALARTVGALSVDDRPSPPRCGASIEGRIALVTGASRGIGASLAERLGSAGAIVVPTARTLDRAAHSGSSHVDSTLGEVVERIRSRGGVAIPVLGDLTDVETPERLVAEVTERVGSIDLVVNNAARAVYRPVAGWTRDAMGKLFQANAIAPADFARLTIPGMIERGFGSIVNLSSIVARHPIGPPYGLFERDSFTTVYAMAKAALDRMSTGWAIETWQSGVRINSISPSGGVRTPGALAMTPMLDRHPENGEPPEVIAEAVLALCEPLEPMITGRVLTSGALLADLGRPVRALDGGQFSDPHGAIDLRDPDPDPEPDHVSPEAAARSRDRSG